MADKLSTRRTTTPALATSKTVTEFFVNVGASLKIGDYHKQNLKDGKYQGRELAKFHVGTALLHVWQLVGLKEAHYPTGKLAETIADFVVSSYPGLAPEEIYQAFAYVLQDRFKANLEHFQVVSALYVNRVLKAYIKWRVLAVAEAAEIAAENARDHKAELRERRQKDDIAVKNAIYGCWLKFKAGKDFDKSILRPHYYDWLVYVGLIEADADALNEKALTVFKLMGKTTYYQVFEEARRQTIIGSFPKLKKEDFELFAKVSYLAI